MSKYVACVAVVVAAAATLIGIPALAGAQTVKSNDATQTNQGFISISEHHGRGALFIQRNPRHRSSAHAASCPAGNLNASYCSPPVEQTLFGAYSWNDGGTTFGSTNTSTCRALGWSSGPCGVYTTVANELIVAFVGADGPSNGGQSVNVTCKTYSGGSCPVTFHKVAAENQGGGDSEVWYADATAIIKQTAPIFVTATAVNADCGSGRNACDVSLQAVTFTNAITAGASGAQGTGVGASGVCYSRSAAPSCSLTTTEPDSFVWAAANNPSSATIPTWPSNQFAVGVADGANRKTFYSQFVGTCTANANGSRPCSTMPLPQSGLYQNPFTLAPTAIPATGTKATINDTAPTNNPFNLVLVEIL